MRRNRGRVADNPLLVGAATVLVALIFVFMSYNANTGLPFVPTYEIKAELPSGANLVAGNDVRIGGARVGQITKITAVRRGNEVLAVAKLKLDQRVANLPVDTKILVRPRSAIGTKYIEVTMGRSTDEIEDGGVIPLANATPFPVELDEVVNTFSEKAREGQRRSVTEFGTALAGRGTAINEAIGQLDPLIGNLIPVMTGLNKPSTRFSNFFRALARSAAEVAPVATEQGELLINLDITFTALAGVIGPIQETIEVSPDAFDTFAREFPRGRPFLRKVTEFSRELQPGFRYLPTFSSGIADMVTYGLPATKHAQLTTPKVKELFREFNVWANDPMVPRGIRSLARLTDILNEPLAFITPSQTVCNYPAILMRNLASLASDGDGLVGWLRLGASFGLPEPGSESLPASQPANGSVDNRLHSNPYPNTAAPGQPRECEAGNEPFDSSGPVIGNSPGNQGTKTDETEIVDKEAVQK